MKAYFFPMAGGGGRTLVLKFGFRYKAARLHLLEISWVMRWKQNLPRCENWGYCPVVKWLLVVK